MLFLIPELKDLLLPVSILRTEIIFITQPEMNYATLKASIQVKQY